MKPTSVLLAGIGAIATYYLIKTAGAEEVPLGAIVTKLEQKQLEESIGEIVPLSATFNITAIVSNYLPVPVTEKVHFTRNEETIPSATIEQTFGGYSDTEIVLLNQFLTEGDWICAYTELQIRMEGIE